MTFFSQTPRAGGAGGAGGLYDGSDFWLLTEEQWV